MRLLHKAADSHDRRGYKRKQHQSAKHHRANGAGPLCLLLRFARDVPMACVDQLLNVLPHGHASSGFLIASMLRRNLVLPMLLLPPIRGLRHRVQLLDVALQVRKHERNLHAGCLAPLLGRHELRGACSMRVGALPRICEVHPLAKETSMQRHHAVVLLRHPLQPRHKLLVQSPVRWHGSGRKRGHDADDPLWRRMGRLDLALDVVYERLTLVDAADRVERRRGVEAIRRHVEVVGDNDARRGGVGVIQDTSLLEKLGVLPKLPKAVLSDARVEVVELHAPSAANLLQLKQLLLDVFTLD
mmetsp:Transcript_9107/g.24775  ORF Transcript_9107/g.24775 Transcript_9107/m.24775 type:complete len:300 (-) Transcript_9107:880-1779(-)